MEDLEAFLLSDESQIDHTFMEEIQNVLNAIVSVKSVERAPVFLSYMFIGAILSLERNPMIHRVGIRTIWMKLNSEDEAPIIHLCYTSQYYRGRIFFRTINLNKNVMKNRTAYTENEMLEIVSGVDSITNIDNIAIDYTVLSIEYPELPTDEAEPEIYFQREDSTILENMIQHAREELYSHARLDTDVPHIPELFKVSWQPKLIDLNYCEDVSDRISLNKTIKDTTYVINEMIDFHNRHKDRFNLAQDQPAYTGFLFGIIKFMFGEKCRIVYDLALSQDGRQLVFRVSTNLIEWYESVNDIPLIVTPCYIEPDKNLYDSDVWDMFVWKTNFVTDAKQALIVSLEMCGTGVLPFQKITTHWQSINQGFIGQIWKHADFVLNSKITMNVKNLEILLGRELEKAVKLVGRTEVSNYIFGQLIGLEPHNEKLLRDYVTFDLAEGKFMALNGMSTYGFTLNNQQFVMIHIFDRSTLEETEFQNFLFTDPPYTDRRNLLRITCILGGADQKLVLRVTRTDYSSFLGRFDAVVNVLTPYNLRHTINDEALWLDHDISNNLKTAGFPSFCPKVTRCSQVLAVLSGILSHKFNVIKTSSSNVTSIDSFVALNWNHTHLASFTFTKCKHTTIENPLDVLNDLSISQSIAYFSGAMKIQLRLRAQFLSIVVQVEKNNLLVRFDQANIIGKKLLRTKVINSYLRCFESGVSGGRNPLCDIMLRKFQAMIPIFLRLNISINTDILVKYSNASINNIKLRLCSMIEEYDIPQHRITSAHQSELMSASKLYIMLSNLKIIQIAYRDVKADILHATSLFGDIMSGNYKTLPHDTWLILINYINFEYEVNMSTASLRMRVEISLLNNKTFNAAFPFIFRGNVTNWIYCISKLVRNLQSYKRLSTATYNGYAAGSVIVRISTLELSALLSLPFPSNKSGNPAALPDNLSEFVSINVDNALSHHIIDSPPSQRVSLDDIVLKAIDVSRSFSQKCNNDNVRRIALENQTREQFDGNEIFKAYLFPTGAGWLTSLCKQAWLNHTVNFPNNIMKDNLFSSQPNIDSCSGNLPVISVDIKSSTQKVNPVLYTPLTLQMNKFYSKLQKSKLNNNVPKNNDEFNRAYYCIREPVLTKEVADRHKWALIHSGSGNDSIYSYKDAKNLIIFGDGEKNVFGGEMDDIFVLNGTDIRGTIYGMDGVNTVDLSLFKPDCFVLNVNLADFYQKIEFVNEVIFMRYIQKFISSPISSSVIRCGCKTEYIKTATKDKVLIEDSDCAYSIEIYISAGVTVQNDASLGSFNYALSSNINRVIFFLSEDRLKVSHHFISKHFLRDIESVEMVRDRMGFSLKMRRLRTYDQTGSIDVHNFDQNCELVFKDAIITTDTSRNLYANVKSDSVQSIHNAYGMLADSLNILVIGRTLSNELCLIQPQLYNKNVIVEIKNDPSSVTHIFGTTADMIYTIRKSDNASVAAGNLFVQDVYIYPLMDMHFTSTIDFTSILIAEPYEVSSTFKIEAKLSENNLIVKLLSSKMKSICQVQIKNITDVFIIDQMSVILNIPYSFRKSKTSKLELYPQSLHFDETSKLIHIHKSDLVENMNMLVERRIGSFNFLRYDETLILTNLVVHDRKINESDVMLIFFDDYFFVSKMKKKNVNFVIQFIDHSVDYKGNAEHITTAEQVNLLFELIENQFRQISLQ